LIQSSPLAPENTECSTRWAVLTIIKQTLLLLAKKAVLNAAIFANIMQYKTHQLLKLKKLPLPQNNDSICG